MKGKESDLHEEKYGDILRRMGAVWDEWCEIESFQLSIKRREWEVKQGNKKEKEE